MSSVLISKSNRKWPKMAKTKILGKMHICVVRRLRFNLSLVVLYIPSN